MQTFTEKALIEKNPVSHALKVQHDGVDRIFLEDRNLGGGGWRKSRGHAQVGKESSETQQEQSMFDSWKCNNVTHLELQNAAIIRILSIQMFGTNAIDIGSIRESRKPQGCGYLDHCSRTGVLLGFLHARLRTVWDQNLLCWCVWQWRQFPVGLRLVCGQVPSIQEWKIRLIWTCTDSCMIKYTYCRPWAVQNSLLSQVC